uniref:(northern house mosquito) hypothetical protein n=1 Tax=Culex pipiens TaxID=7175 RepID=A0A8D8BBQ6_CULPI
MDCNMWKDSKNLTHEIVLLLVEYIYLFEKCTKNSTGIFLPSLSLSITVALTESVRNILKSVTNKKKQQAFLTFESTLQITKKVKHKTSYRAVNEKNNRNLNGRP